MAVWPRPRMRCMIPPALTNPENSILASTDLAQLIRSIPDYPKPGIVFRDITTLLQDADGLAHAVEGLARPFRTEGVDLVAGVEARGLILGGAVACALGVGFVPIRKRGKLPHETVSQAYALEYGVDHIEIHADAVAGGQRVLLIDDLVATGGTAEAAVALIRRLGGRCTSAAFVIDLPDLGGADRVRALGVDVHTLVSFPGH